MSLELHAHSRGIACRRGHVSHRHRSQPLTRNRELLSTAQDVDHDARGRPVGPLLDPVAPSHPKETERDDVAVGRKADDTVRLADNDGFAVHVVEVPRVGSERLARRDACSKQAHLTPARMSRSSSADRVMPAFRAMRSSSFDVCGLSFVETTTDRTIFRVFISTKSTFLGRKVYFILDSGRERSTLRA